ncbi:hypothetical protein INR49_012267 [Caranx melampygus]|nr:hypothetical protein INR49_012267 [Caranx melampygus]
MTPLIVGCLVTTSPCSKINKHLHIRWSGLHVMIISITSESDVYFNKLLSCLVCEQQKAAGNIHNFQNS